VSLSFHGDDYVWLLAAKHDSVADVFTYFYDSQGFFYRPFTKLYFWLVWPYFQTNAYWYHLSNVLIHFFNSLLVFWICRVLLKKLFARSGYMIQSVAFATALLFYVLPAHVENVVWISAVTELLPAFFVLLGVYLFLRYARSRFSVVALLGIYVCQLCGLFSHEYVVIFPALIFVTEYFVHSSGKTVVGRVLATLQRNRLLYIGMVVIDVLYLIIRFIAGSHWQGGDYSYNLVKLPFNVIGNLLGYVGINYIGLSFIEQYAFLREYFKHNLVISVISFALVVFLSRCVGTILYRKLRNTRTFSLMLFVCSFVVISLLPFLGLGSLAERYLYLPSVVLLLLLSYCVWRIVFSIPFQETTLLIFYWGVVGLLVVYYAFGFYLALGEWKQASAMVEDRMYEFQHLCGKFSQNQEISRPRVPSRIGRAWVFQVGYEQGANVYCDKNLKIFTQ
jgi:hypothetical protein